MTEADIRTLASAIETAIIVGCILAAVTSLLFSGGISLAWECIHSIRAARRVRRLRRVRESRSQVVA